MIATALNELFVTVVRSLPTLFLLGVPVLLLVITLAAYVDAEIPRDHTAPWSR